MTFAEMAGDIGFKLCWEEKEGEDGRTHKVLCQEWRGCPGKGWYSMGDIQYCRNQVIWMIDNMIEYDYDHYVTAASWPEEPKGETGYNDILVQHSVPQSANFEHEIQVTAEVLFRLERTGKDGRLLLKEIKNAELLKKGGRYVSKYSHDAGNALNYIAGWRRKKLSYFEWLNQRKARALIEIRGAQLYNK